MSVRALSPRGIRRGLVLMQLAAACLVACDDSFEFDLPVAGAAGSAGMDVMTAGSSSGGTAGGAGRGGCGTRDACPTALVCMDGECVECLTQSECAGTVRPHCDPGRRRCVECVEMDDCADGFVCDPRANRCLKGCRDRDDCPLDAHGCDTAHAVCYECDEDYECAASPLGALCAIDGSSCVECRNDSDCPQHCDTLAGRCVECRDGRDCPSRACDPTLHLCLGGDE